MLFEFGKYVFGGILDRHPGLRIGWFEAGINWVPAAIHAGNRFHYRTKRHWRHNLLNLGVLAAIVAGLGGLALALAIDKLAFVDVAVGLGEGAGAVDLAVLRGLFFYSAACCFNS